MAKADWLARRNEEDSRAPRTTIALSEIDEAEECLREAIRLIAKATKGTVEQGRAEAYILPHLKAWIDGHEMITLESIRESLSDEGNFYPEE